MTISTPDLCDEYGDAVRVADPVFKHYGAIRQFGGEVVTVKCFEDNSKVGEMVRTPGKGRILVVDGGGSPRRSLLGDQLVTLAVENDWSGIVIYGYIRDIEEIETMQMGVVALGAIPRKTEKLGVGEVNVTIDVAGLQIQPGQYIYADRSGVIVADQSLL
ncbi:MAG: putative 4-hydroxy-4-methyl-2-oxoglutarate aldolase [Oceanicoccus sp.]|uniref:putative 4-hydroxy-4-methyl-2-oxoglutarate aldolase n=1 Tax=Oceanicoccus sp. TaxID=2691044 RepID=UPI00262F8340|nr:putative 4-hydroxy-4-methyl-2-oxoglutarate aldolase [Oceanicoccus sp.]MCP3906484.1 putative 4-hydroxy-4-methyl-2-oxoglutarate aldolase [Oceanicoccus sp.]MDG1772823.1 putative 4-hydroxy-4-methyl-2-oxoglutarate aldolase [Oceanicoccus sp.]